MASSTPATVPELRDLLAVTLLNGVGPTLTDRLLSTFSNNPASVLSAALPALKSIEGIGHTKARAIIDSQAQAIERAERAIDRAAQLNVRLLSITDPNYPALLNHLPDPPPILFVAGSLPHAEPALAIVGTRNASHYGIEQAERFASILAAQSLTIVSGGARGIDTAAHRATLRTKGRTVAVLGSGHANLYPEENTSLFHDIVANQGAVISELPPDTTPTPETFPRRNRIIAALALATLVIEAPKRSGALITARQAVEELGRDAIAIPHRIDVASAQGSNALIRDGHAAPVLEPQDVKDILQSRARQLAIELQSPKPQQQSSGVQPQTSTTQHTPTPTNPPSPTHNAILSALREPKTLDELLAATNLTPAEALPAITTLEIQGQLKREGQSFRIRQ